MTQMAIIFNCLRMFIILFILLKEIIFVFSTVFDVNMWYSSNPSQNCVDLCAGLSLQCDPDQMMQLNTYQRIQEVVTHFGSSCHKGDGYWSQAPIYEYYGGRGCWYFGDPSYTYQDALNGCGVASNSWNKRVCACSVVSTDSNVPSSHPTSLLSVIPTLDPTVILTFDPTALPTTNPTIIQSTNPTALPTTNPTIIPSTNPTTLPTINPTMIENIKYDIKLSTCEEGNYCYFIKTNNVQENAMEHEHIFANDSNIINDAKRINELIASKIIESNQYITTQSELYENKNSDLKYNMNLVIKNRKDNNKRKKENVLNKLKLNHEKQIEIQQILNNHTNSKNDKVYKINY